MDKISKVSIYKLWFPFDRLPFYVGQTVNVSKRASQHSANGRSAWRMYQAGEKLPDTFTHRDLYIGEQISKKHCLQISVIEQTSPEFAHIREAYWIAKLQAEGYTLHNVHPPLYPQSAAQNVLEKIRQVEIDLLTPMDALQLLKEMRGALDAYELLNVKKDKE